MIKQVLITRPWEQAVTLAAQVHTLGLQPIIFPAIQIAEVPENIAIENAKLLNNINSNKNNYDAIIFISPIAVQKLAAKIHTIPQKTLLVAVGESTASYIEQQGWRKAIYPSENFNSAALLELPILQQITHKRILICKGMGGNSEPANTLRARGAQVFQALLYQRCLPAPAQLPDLQKIQFIICTSSESLQNLLRLFDKTILEKIWLVSSQHLQLLAKNRGIRHLPQLAENASDAAIIKALQQLIS